MAQTGDIAPLRMWHASNMTDQNAAEIDEIRKGYTFDEPALDLGVLMEADEAQPEVRIRIPLSMLNRHGLVAGATGTGKTKTLQVLAEQISAGRRAGLRR